MINDLILKLWECIWKKIYLIIQTNSEGFSDYYSDLAEMYTGYLGFEKPDTSSHALLLIVAITSSISFQPSDFLHIVFILGWNSQTINFALDTQLH